MDAITLLLHTKIPMACIYLQSIGNKARFSTCSRNKRKNMNENV